MFFTRLGTLIAYIGLVMGILRAAMGINILLMFDDITSYTAATKRYLGSTSPGEAIDKGAVCILVSVALGILCEISKSRKVDASNQDIGRVTSR